VAVGASKPDLLDGLPFLRLVCPKGRLERCAVLVDRKRVIAVLDAARKLGVVKLMLASSEKPQAAQGNAERAHGVPHPDHANLDPASAADGVSLAESARGVLVRMLGIAVKLDCFTVLGNRRAPENAALANHAAQAACRERAATESEQKDLVARLVVPDEEAVRLMDVLFEP